MESPARKVSRLLGALETLSDQEFTLLNSGEYTEALSVQNRRQPLVDEIARIMAEPGVAESLDPAVQVQAEELIKKQAEALSRLASDKAAVTSQLNSISAALSRTQHLHTAYRSNSEPGPSQGYNGTA